MTLMGKGFECGPCLGGVFDGQCLLLTLVRVLSSPEYRNRISAAIPPCLLTMFQDATRNVLGIGRGPPPVEASLQLVRRGCFFLDERVWREVFGWGFRGGFWGEGRNMRDFLLVGERGEAV